MEDEYIGGMTKECVDRGLARLDDAGERPPGRRE